MKLKLLIKSVFITIFLSLSTKYCSQAQSQLIDVDRVSECGINAWDIKTDPLGGCLGVQTNDSCYLATVCVNQEFCINSEETFWTNFLYTWTNAQITYDFYGASTNPSPVPNPSQNTNNLVCYSYNASGIYPVMIWYHSVNVTPQVDEYCGPFYIRVINPPDPSFNLSPNPVCPGQLVCATLNHPNQYISIQSINWHEVINDPICGPNTSTGHTVTGHPNCFEYDRQGQYLVTVYTESICGADSTTDTVIVSLQPDFTWTGHCALDTVSFTDATACSANQISSWLWNFGDGTTSTLQNPTHTFANGGTYNVTLTVYDNFPNCPGSTSVVKQVYIYGSPAKPNVTGPLDACTQYSVYTISPFPQGTYSWSFNGSSGQINSDQFTINYSSGVPSSDLIVYYTDSNGCTSSDTLRIAACCGGQGSSNVYFDATYTTIPFSNYSTIYINGTVKFDLSSPDTITRVKFKMGENAKIILMNNTQLTINSSKFTQGCDKMWDMIYIPQTTSKLTFNNDTLMDAINGVYSDNGGNIDLNTSLFKNNYRCVQIKRYGQSTGVNHPAHIAQCYFYGAASPNYLPCSPLTGKRSHAGVIVSDVGLCNTEYGATIGDSLNADKRNYFRSLIYGVIDSNSNVRVINNRFAKFYSAYVQNGTTIYPTAIEAYSKKLVQQGQPLPKFTLNVGGNLTNKINYIDTCNKGIHIARNISLKASYNILKNGYMGIHYESNLQGNKVSINYNLISKYYYGIVSVLNNKCTSRIVRNWINSTNGIYAVGFDQNNANESIIVDYDSIHAYNCITYKTLYSPVSRCDTLKIKTYSSAPSAGLFVEGCNFHQSQNLKTYGASTNRSYGAYIVSSGDFRYICSYINNVDTAIQFVGYNATNTEYSLMKNSLNNSDVGLTLFHNGNIGPSGSPTKPILIQWNNVSTRNWSINSDAANQVIYYNSSLGSYYNPLTSINNKTGIGSTVTAFTSLNISGTSNKSCPNCPTLTLGMSMVQAQIADSVDEKPVESANSNQMLLQTYYTPLTYLAEITKGTFDFPMFNDNAKYIEKANAYTAICSDTAYFYTNTDLQNFKRQNDTSNIGKLYRVKKYFNTDSYSTAENLNNSINPRNVIEKLNKSIFGIMISFLTNDTLTGENIDSLRVYAYLCPLEYGNSVYNARALLTKVDSIGTTYISSCEGSTMVKSMITGNNDNNQEQENVLNNNNNENIKVYPNPAKDKLVVEYYLPDNVGSKHFELFDILGNKLKSVLLTGNIGSISISVEDLKEGMYLYRFISSNKIISYNKLVIIK